MPRHAPLPGSMPDPVVSLPQCTVDLSPGQVIAGAWRLVYIAGQGAGGVTWRATQLADEQDVALKVVFRRGADGVRLGNLLREAAFLCELRHPNIVRYLGVIDLPETPGTWLVMEWVGGGELGEWIERFGPATPAVATTLLLQLTDALEFLHERGVLHRDVKPANVLVRLTDSGPPHLLLADFGISQHLVEGRSISHGPVGTPGYAPPESWLGVPLTSAADAFGLGALAWHLVTGRPPPFDPDEQAPDRGHLMALIPHATSPRGRSILHLAIDLLAANPAHRPTLSEVRLRLERADVDEEPARPCITMVPLPAAPRSGEPIAALSAEEEEPEDAALRGDDPAGRRFFWILAACCALAFLLCGGAAVDALLRAGKHAGDGETPAAASAPISPSAPITEPPETLAAGVSPAAPPRPEPALQAPPPAVAGEPQRVTIVAIGAAPLPTAPTSRPPPSGPVGELRVGLRAVGGLPADARLVVTTADGASHQAAGTQLTVNATVSGRVLVELRAGEHSVAAASCEVPAGAIARVQCDAPSSDFKGLTCEVR